MNRRSDLPPLPSLRAFAVAGRLQSLRDAAAELGVTPSAVSHQVKALEAWLGVPLFDRGVRQVRLNADGLALSRALNEAFNEMHVALDLVRRGGKLRALRVATVPLFASAWLAPRLHHFEARHQDLSLSIHTDARLYDMRAGEADVAIRSLRVPDPALHGRKLLDLRAAPLCAPDIARRLLEPADLANASLIAYSVGRAGWPEWLAAAGVPGLKARRTITVDTVPDAISAAVQGRGVMLGLLPLIWDLATAANLVVPFDIAPQDAGAYYIVCRKEDRARPLVRTFMDWLVEEMRKDTRRLNGVERARLHATYA